jgi:hypothetical protein
MGIKEILVGLFLRGKPGKDGIWDYLGKRSADKNRVDLEKVRNDGTQKLVPLLKPGMVVTEGGPDWHREIRMPEALPSAMLLTAVMSQPPTPPLPADELDSAPQNELEPATQNELEPPPRNETDTARRQAQGQADEPS